MEATNPDVLAFHEAFADIVALFRHFSFTEILEHQIAKTRGDLGSENILAQLACQFGLARGIRGALRDAIGYYDKEKAKWISRVPDPTELDRTTEVHARGAILVAAVFDAFLSIYQKRTRDLFRLASGDGTGILPDGEIHPDLVKRLANEAVKASSHVLNMCIRALDYCPPVDLTFGEYLRALITADIDLMPEDQHGYRVAFIEAFRRRGIYPRDIRILSQDSLKWPRPTEDPTVEPGETEAALRDFIKTFELRKHVDSLRYFRDRKQIWDKTRSIRTEMHNLIAEYLSKALLLQRITGLQLAPTKSSSSIQMKGDSQPSFYVSALREARRQREDGHALNQAFITIIQKRLFDFEGEEHEIRCGCTLVLNLDEMRVLYVISKGLDDEQRLLRTAKFRSGQAQVTSLAETYFGSNPEIFAALHADGG